MRHSWSKIERALARKRNLASESDRISQIEKVFTDHGPGKGNWKRDS